MKIIIIGCGRVGAGLAQIMSRSSHKVTVVDSDPVAFERLGPAFKGQVVPGICFDRNVLMKSGIEKADALAAVTASDEANLVAARAAKSVFKVPRVAARVYEPNKAKIYRRLGIQTISPVTLGIERLTATLIYSNLAIERVIGAGQVNLIDIDAKPAMVNKLVTDVNVPGEVDVVAITRNGKTFMPNSATLFQVGDLVHLFVLAGAQDKISKAFGS